MEDSYCSGSDNHILCALYKDARWYTNPFDEENPGGVLKYFSCPQKAIGNQASLADLAACMNCKPELNNCMVGRKKATFNSSNIYLWFRWLDDKNKSPVEKPALTEEMEGECVKWCKKIKRLICRIGGNFYACFFCEMWFYLHHFLLAGDEVFARSAGGERGRCVGQGLRQQKAGDFQ